jgi:hypothetical protein
MTGVNVYDALRCEHFLIEHRSQGRLTRAAEGTDQARSLFLADLTRSVAEVLVAAYPKKDSNAYPPNRGEWRRQGLDRGRQGDG